MYEKFGEFASVEELNEAAAGFKAEGDFESLKALAEENGITALDAQDYIEDCVPTLATITSASYARINLETREQKHNAPGIFMAISDSLSNMLPDAELEEQIMSKGKRIQDIYDAFVDMAKKKGSGWGCSGTSRQVEKIIRAYYKDGKEEAAKVIEELYG